MFQLYDKCGESGPRFEASSAGDNAIDCVCTGWPGEATNWDVSKWHAVNPDGNIVEMQNKLAQISQILMGGAFRVYQRDDGWKGGTLAISNNDNLEVDGDPFQKLETDYLTNDMVFTFWGDN
jgi:hypothetical protein